ncbi:polyprenyl synthetase family protein [Nanoarchaeota archaeon]
MKNQTTKSNYFRNMKETSRIAQTHLFLMLKDKIPNHIKNDFHLFPNIRKEKIWARPWVIRMAYELGGGKDWRNFTKLGAILELENISNYQSNASFDFKYGVSEENDRMKQIIVSFISRSLVQTFIEESIDDKDLLLECLRLVNEIDFYNYLGQYNEFDKMNIKHFNLDMDYEEYFDVYLMRCYSYGGVWLKNILALGLLFSEDKNYDYLKVLQHFGKILGTGWMVLNDVTDYFIEAGEHGMNYKLSSDEFKDVWNGRITLPIFHALKTGNDFEVKFIFNILNGRISKSNKNTSKLFEILLKRESLDFAYSIANYFRKRAKNIIKQIPLEKRHYLSIFADAIKSNKFVFEFRKHGLKVISINSGIKKKLVQFENET